MLGGADLVPVPDEVEQPRELDDLVCNESANHASPPISNAPTFRQDIEHLGLERRCRCRLGVPGSALRHRQSLAAIARRRRHRHAAELADLLLLVAEQRRLSRIAAHRLFPETSIAMATKISMYYVPRRRIHGDPRLSDLLGVREERELLAVRQIVEILEAVLGLGYRVVFGLRFVLGVLLV